MSSIAGSVQSVRQLVHRWNPIVWSEVHVHVHVHVHVLSTNYIHVLVVHVAVRLWGMKESCVLSVNPLTRCGGGLWLMHVYIYMPVSSIEGFGCKILCLLLQHGLTSSMLYTTCTWTCACTCELSHVILCTMFPHLMVCCSKEQQCHMSLVVWTVCVYAYKPLV